VARLPLPARVFLKLRIATGCRLDAVSALAYIRLDFPLILMTTRLLAITAASLAVIVSSCHPVHEAPVKKPVEKKLTAEEEAKKKEEEARKKAEEEKKKAEEALAATQPTVGPITPPVESTPPPPQPQPEPRRDFPFANKVPGKDGFVFSPYNNKVVDVRDIASGTLVQDPTYPVAERKYFRVP
jgi:hypothetical protein